MTEKLELTLFDDDDFDYVQNSMSEYYKEQDQFSIERDVSKYIFSIKK